MERYCTKCGKITTQKSASLLVCAAGHENWLNPAVGATVYVLRGDTVLYGVRSRDPGKGRLDLPGGFVEVGETAEQAALREIKEELGIDITITAFLGTYATTYEGRPVLNLAYVATTASPQVTPGDDMKGGAPVWRRVDDLPGPGEQAADWFTQANNDFLAWYRQHK